MKPVLQKPFTNATSGQPVPVHGTCNPMVTIGEKGGPQVKGAGQFRAMDVAKPLLSVSKLVQNGWTVTFGPGTSRDDWRCFQYRHGFSWAAGRRVEGVTPVETQTP